MYCGYSIGDAFRMDFGPVGLPAVLQSGLVSGNHLVSACNGRIFHNYLFSANLQKPDNAAPAALRKPSFKRFYGLLAVRNQWNRKYEGTGDFLAQCRGGIIPQRPVQRGSDTGRFGMEAGRKA